MTRFIIRIDDEKQKEMILRFLEESAIKYELRDDDENSNILNEEPVAYQKTELAEERFVLTDHLKQMLDEREAEFLRGDRTLVTAEESRAEIERLLSGKK